ncbi:MAG: hypothetical protein ACK470_15410 [Pseudanabaena sp.]
MSNATRIIIDDLRSRYACPVRQNIKSRQSDREIKLTDATLRLLK